MEFVRTPMNIVICEYAPGRTEAFQSWLPNATIVRRYLGERIPPSFDGIIFAGGPMSAHAQDRKSYPFLQEDFAVIQQLAGQEDGPWIVGVCLGAQLITFALGGDVEEGEFVRGWNRIHSLTDDVLFKECDEPVQFEFHRNHIKTLPDGAVCLAKSEHDSVEAYRIGSRILAAVYHPEITATDANRIYDMAHVTEFERHEDRFAEPSSGAFRASEQFFNAVQALGKGEGLC
jgi:GMP synthase-like glutamine amidotransferase